MVRIDLGHAGYSLVDAEMRKRGYSTTILGKVDGQDRQLQLPPGHYWRDEPTDEERMRDEALGVVESLGELGAQIVATSGLSAWHGLVPADWTS